MYLNIFSPQTSPLSLIGRDLLHACSFLNNYSYKCIPLLESGLVFPFMKADLFSFIPLLVGGLILIYSLT